MLHWLTRFMWTPLARRTPPYGAPCIVTWERANGAGSRMATWHNTRKFNGKDFGPGFVCWYTGTPLTDKITYWMPPLALPQTPSTPVQSNES